MCFEVFKCGLFFVAEYFRIIYPVSSNSTTIIMVSYCVFLKHANFQEKNVLAICMTTSNSNKINHCGETKSCY